MNSPESVKEEIYPFGNTVFNYSTNELRTGNNKILITSRQAEILRILSTNLNVAVSREHLLSTIWGNESYANSLALNVQITYLRKALQHDPSVKITSLVKKGYVLMVP
jgi:DNA-binding response OmpR family regulator